MPKDVYNHSKKYELVNKRCLNCHTKFIVKENNNQKYCSHKCYGEHNKGINHHFFGKKRPEFAQKIRGRIRIERKTVICNACGGEFKTPVTRIHKYCSSRCQRIGSAKIRSDKNHFLWVDREKRGCEICRKIFITKVTSLQKYCSWDCQHIGMANTLKLKRLENPYLDEKIRAAQRVAGKKSVEKMHEVVRQKRKEDPNFDKKYREKRREAGKKGAISAIIKNRQNYPYVFMGCKFDSAHEAEICKLLVKHEIIQKPIEGVNVHFRVDSKEFDFFPQQKVFIEFHPWDFRKTEKEYYDNRRKVLDINGFEGVPLIVLKELENFEKFILPLFE